MKYPPANAGDTGDAGSILELGRSPGIGNGNPLQYSCLENSMDRRSLWILDHGVTMSQTRLSTHTNRSLLRLKITGKTQRDRVEREVGGGIGMGNTMYIHG